LLAGIDDRLAAVFPAVMVSTAMQGGCVCENCSYLRVDTGNIELAALFAPKPLAMSAANDWTKDLMTKGYPELKSLYKIYGAEDKVSARAWLEYGHQYNQHAREFMYSWFSKHLLGKDEAVKEAPYKPTLPKELSVFDSAHPRPADELNAEKLRAAMAKASDEQISKLAPTDAASLEEFRRVVGTALRVMVGDQLPQKIAIRSGPLESLVDGQILHRAVLGRFNEKDAVPGAGVIGPKGRDRGVVVWLHPRGKTSLFENGKAVAAVKALTDAGFAVMAPDVLGVGELAGQPPVDKAYAGYTFGYNRSLLAKRVHDVLTAVAFGKSMLRGPVVHVVGWGEMGPVAVLAKALAGDAVKRLAADLNQFRFETITDTADPMMLPGAVKYGGLPAFLALCAPGEVLAHNHRGTATGRLPEAAYDSAGEGGKLIREQERLEDMKVVEWLVR
jgi:pimeloyl-ACP methyl ester carboxylesterase